MFFLTFPRLTNPTPWQEFGIDIIGEDNKTTIHHKVAARVMCVFTDEDAHLAARVEAIPSSASLPPNIPSVLPPATSSSGGSNNFSFAHPQRRPALQSQLGGMGGSMRPPSKNGLTFEHILSRLQGELQKSRETGAELHSLSTAMNDIHDTLGGSVVRRPLLSVSFHTDYLHSHSPKIYHTSLNHSLPCVHNKLRQPLHPYPHLPRPQIQNPLHLPQSTLPFLSCAQSYTKPKLASQAMSTRSAHSRICLQSTRPSRPRLQLSATSSTLHPHVPSTTMA